MNYAIPIGALFIAFVDWLAVGYNRQKVEVVLKPAVMLVLIAWIIFMGGLSEVHLGWFLAGAIFSMIGDIFMLRDDIQPLFLGGLISFFLAHLSYIVAMNDQPFVFSPGIIILAVIILAMLVFIAKTILKGVVQNGWGTLSLPILFYITVIGVMLFSATSRLFAPNWNFLPALLVAVGAILFASSDLCLSWDKFIKPIRYGRVKIMTTYHIGQIAIMIGAILQFSGMM